MRAVILLTVTGGLSQAVGFVYRIFLTRLAGAEVLGLYQLILPVYSVLLSLTAVGLTTAVANLSARYAVLGNFRAVYQVRGLAMRLFLLMVVLPGAALMIFSDAASVYLLGDARTQLGLILLVPCLILTGTENIHKHYFYGVGRVAPAAVCELAEQVLKAGIILALLAALAPDTPEKTVGVIVLGMVAVESLSALGQILLFRLDLGRPAKLEGKTIRGTVLRRQMGRIALPLGFAALLGNLITSANAVLIPRLLVLGGMEQGEAVSAYGVTFGMTLPLLMLPTAFLSGLGLVLTPKLAQSFVIGEKAKIRQVICRSVEASNLLLIPALALLTALGPTIGGVLYKEPAVGRDLPVLALGVLFSCWQSLFSWVLCGIDRQGSSAMIALACDSLQLLLTCLTVGRFGMSGYSVSFAAASLLGALLTWRAAARAVALKTPLFSWLGAPLLMACLGASCGSLMEGILRRNGLAPLPAALGAMVFGILLCLAALEALGVGVKNQRKS